MKKRTLSWVVGTVILLLVGLVGSSVANIEQFRREGDEWYQLIEVGGYFLWIPINEYELPDQEVIAERPRPDDDGDLTRFTIPEITWIWDPDPVPVPAIYRESEGEWETINLTLTLDPALRDGQFLSTDDGKYRVTATTQASNVSWQYNPIPSGPTGSGQLIFDQSASQKSPKITFNPPDAPGGRNHSLQWEIIAQIYSKQARKTIKQDKTATLQQQYIDFDRRRWFAATATVPARSEFSSSYSTTNYTYGDYGLGRNPIVMHLGPIAEKIRKHEDDSLKTTEVQDDGTIKTTHYFPRVTSGYRKPSDRESINEPRSLHQWGYALDMNPVGKYKDTPGREAKVRRTRKLIGTANYDTEIHALGTLNEHVHIEQQRTSDQGGGPDI